MDSPGEAAAVTRESRCHTLDQIFPSRAGGCILFFFAAGEYYTLHLWESSFWWRWCYRSSDASMQATYQFHPDTLEVEVWVHSDESCLSTVRQGRFVTHHRPQVAGPPAEQLYAAHCVPESVWGQGQGGRYALASLAAHAVKFRSVHPSNHACWCQSSSSGQQGSLLPSPSTLVPTQTPDQAADGGGGSVAVGVRSSNVVCDGAGSKLRRPLHHVHSEPGHPAIPSRRELCRGFRGKGGERP